MEALQIIDQQVADERKLYENIFELLGYEKITFNGVYHLKNDQNISSKLDNSRFAIETLSHWGVRTPPLLRIVSVFSVQQPMGG